MSAYYIIESIQNARTIPALEEVEKWINELTHHAAALADLALIKKCELLINQYVS